MEAVWIGVFTGFTLLCTVGSFIGGVRTVARYARFVDVGMTCLYIFVFAGRSTDSTVMALSAGATSLVCTQILRRYWVWAAKRGYLQPLEPPKKITPAQAVDRAQATVVAAGAMARLFAPKDDNRPTQH